MSRVVRPSAVGCRNLVHSNPPLESQLQPVPGSLTGWTDALHFRIFTTTGWLNRRQEGLIGGLVSRIEILREQLGGRWLRLTDAQRRRLAMRGTGSSGARACSVWLSRHARHDAGLEIRIQALKCQGPASIAIFRSAPGSWP